MSIDLSLREQERFADTVRRAGSDLSARERRTELVVALGFLAAVAALFAIRPPAALDLETVLICTAVLALAAMVPFATPFGFTVPTQLAFVPLVFAAPVAVVPVATAIAVGLGRVPEIIRGEMRAGRLLGTPGNAWFSIGPAAVFAAADTAPEVAAPGLLLAALASQFVVDFGVSTFRDVVGRGASLFDEFSETWWVYAIDAGLSLVGLEVAYHLDEFPAAALGLVPLLGLMAMFARERQRRLDSLLELNAAYRGTALVLGDVVEADDGYTGAHSRGVVNLALAVGERLGLSPERQRNLEFAALLHDVGKIAIPNTIINKPGRLDAHERALIETHTIVGQDMLDRVGGFMVNVGRIVRSHHERWDGCGYPDKLAGEAIPLESRIIACCDTWNAMRTDRSYRRALSHEVALTELRDVAGSQLDPTLVPLLIEIIGSVGPVEPPGDEPASGKRPAELVATPTY